MVENPKVMTPSAASDNGTVWLSDVEQVAFLLACGHEWTAVRRDYGKTEFRFEHVAEAMGAYMENAAVGVLTLQRARDQVWQEIKARRTDGA